MKTIKSSLLLDNLMEQTRAIILQAEQLKHSPVEALEKTPARDAWSVAQVLEHLNIYCRYYLDAIENKLHHNQTSTAVYFLPGWLGNYFTKLMQPGNNGLIKKKMTSIWSHQLPRYDTYLQLLLERIDFHCSLLCFGLSCLRVAVSFANAVW